MTPDNTDDSKMIPMMLKPKKMNMSGQIPAVQESALKV